MKINKNVRVIILLLMIDLSAYYLSLSLAFLTRKILNVMPVDIIHFDMDFYHFLKLWWMPIIYIAFIAYEGLYTKRYTFWEETKELLKAITIATVVVFAIVSLGKMTHQISRLSILFLWLYGIFIFPVFRFLGKNALYKLGIWERNVIIIGAGQAGISTAKGLIQDKYIGYKIVGFLDDSVKSPVKLNDIYIPVIGGINDFDRIIQEIDVEAVIVAVPSMEKEKLSKLTNHIHKYVRRVFIVPDLKGIALLNSELYHLFMQQLFLIKIKNNLDSSVNRFLKRGFDVILSVCMLPFILPVMLVIGLLIKIDSPGPVFFSHTRIGKNGREIKVYKFRSMYIDAEKRLADILKSDPRAREEWEKHFKLKDDPRITRIGRILRKTSLDELPQIFNVLKGDMSLVGPRPVTRKEIENYYKEYADYYYMVRPGITGLWQVSGRSDTDYDFRVKLDTWYVLNWSLWLDLVILIKTFRTVILREGAY